MTTNLKFPINYTYQTGFGRSGNETIDGTRLSVPMASIFFLFKLTMIGLTALENRN